MWLVNILAICQNGSMRYSDSDTNRVSGAQGVGQEDCLQDADRTPLAPVRPLPLPLRLLPLPPIISWADPPIGGRAPGQEKLSEVSRIKSWRMIKVVMPFIRAMKNSRSEYFSSLLHSFCLVTDTDPGEMFIVHFILICDWPISGCNHGVLVGFRQPSQSLSLRIFLSDMMLLL